MSDYNPDIVVQSWLRANKEIVDKHPNQTYVTELRKYFSDDKIVLILLINQCALNSAESE